MRLIALVLLSLSLVVGMLTAATAYNVPLANQPDSVLKRLIGRELAQDAGLLRDDQGQPVLDESGAPRPLVRAVDQAGQHTVIDADVLNTLGAGRSGAPTIRLRSFDWSLWQHRWWFVLAIAGLFAGSMLMRLDQKRRVAAAIQDRPATEGPAAALAQIRSSIDALRARLPEIADRRQALRLILRELSELQRTHLPAIPDARTELVGRLGLGRYAELMDRFAAMERQVNRAWSAAADGVLEEARDSLERAAAILPEVEARLGRAGG